MVEVANQEQAQLMMFSVQIIMIATMMNLNVDVSMMVMVIALEMLHMKQSAKMERKVILNFAVIVVTKIIKKFTEVIDIIVMTIIMLNSNDQVNQSIKVMVSKKQNQQMYFTMVWVQQQVLLIDVILEEAKVVILMMILKKVDIAGEGVADVANGDALIDNVYEFYGDYGICYYNEER
ncbi:MAG: hypothetical protein EZS28_019746 [Streblomastix strix]|uniref:Uncharacterized protein n=1 Tax=Streblomastix strix TaxID=222440 RepID=A0A5J4VPZ8_9EUKA|nr:MAG: hypothetical protein EZS28_019746 [Streblomastix strix]